MSDTAFNTDPHEQAEKEVHGVFKKAKGALLQTVHPDDPHQLAVLHSQAFVYGVRILLLLLLLYHSHA